MPPLRGEPLRYTKSAESARHLRNAKQTLRVMAEPPAIVIPSADHMPALEQARWFVDEVQPHEGQLKAYLRGAFPAVRDVDDVVQESYLRLWRSKLGGRIDSARSFLFQVARHLAIDAERRRQTAATDTGWNLAELPVLEEAPDAAEALSYKEKVSLMAEALAHLPTRCRETFVLRKFQGVPQKTIAAQLGISERTVESHVTRGMKLCEAYLRRRGVTSFAHDVH